MRKMILGLMMVGTAGMAETRLMTWPDLLERPRPTGGERIAYGTDPLQHVRLWRPAGKGPFPVVLMVHGGCWQTGIADASIMDWAAADLAKRGIAVWNIDYRGVDRPGGGWPGTFQDVAAAADLLRVSGPALGLKTDRVVAIGHSAGGHLALWLAARPKLPAGSVLASADPLKLHTVISIGGLPDLEAALTPPGDTCGPEPVRALIGSGRADPFAETSPARLKPDVPTVLVNAARDRIAPPAFAEAYAKKVGPVRRITIADEGHAELIAPGSKSWDAEVRLIEEALGIKP